MGQKNFSTAEIKYIIRTLFASGNIQGSVFRDNAYTDRGVASAKKYTFAGKNFSISYTKWVVDDTDNITDTRVRGYSSDNKLASRVQVVFPNRPAIYFSGQDAVDIANFCEQYCKNPFTMASLTTQRQYE